MASVNIRLGTLTNSCFVIMPFTPTFKTVYERVIKQAVKEIYIECIRSDEIYSKPHIMSDIWKSLRCARVVIAELTGKNTNVFYELGLAHAIGKPVIIITRNEEDVPFDLKALRYLYYNTDDPFWGDNLRKRLISMLKSVLEEKGYGTVFDDIKLGGEQEYVEAKVVGKKKEIVLDLSGDWTGNMRMGSGAYLIELKIAQNGNALSGTMYLTFTSSGKRERSIVREDMAGEIDNSGVTLFGVLYSYLEQGASKSYNLDSFSLKLSSNGKRMTGTVKSDGDTGKVTLSKKD